MWLGKGFISVVGCRVLKNRLVSLLICS